MVALVKGRGDQAYGLGLLGVPGRDELGSDGRHCLFCLQARVEKPQTGDGGEVRGELGEAVDGDEDAGDGEGLRRDGGRGGRGALEGVVRCRHGRECGESQLRVVVWLVVIRG